MAKNNEVADFSAGLLEDIKSGFASFKSTGRACFMTDANVNVDNWLSTGSWMLDLILSNRVGVGGIPRGRLTEISGGEGAGKSMMGNYIMADCQRKGGAAVLIDTEHAAAYEVMQSCGVDIDKLIHVEVGTVEEVFQTMESISSNIKRNAGKDRPPLCIVWDSVAATPCKAEVEGEYGDNTIALKARLLSQGLRKFMSVASEHDVYLVFINQLRTKIGVTFGDNKVTPGGAAIPFHASIRLRLSHFKEVKNADKNTIGKIVKCEVKKNKVAPPMRTMYYYMRWGDKLGAWIDDEETIWDSAVTADVIKKVNNVTYKFKSITTGKDIEFSKKKFLSLWKEEVFQNELKEALAAAYIIGPNSLDDEGITITD